jgi:hypothetical protein
MEPDSTIGRVLRGLDKTLYSLWRKLSILMPRHQKAGQNRNIKLPNKSFENVAKVQIFGNDGSNQNLIYEGKSRLGSWNACYRAVQNLLRFPLLFKNVKIKI